jgi:hypothetical protein
METSGGLSKEQLQKFRFEFVDMKKKKLFSSNLKENANSSKFCSLRKTQFS